MRDVAEAVGLSQTTVSHVLRGREVEFRIGADTAERVRAAARRLRYQPSALARNLKHHRAYTLALAVGDLSNPFWAGLALAAQNEAERHGYMLVVNHTGESPVKERQLLGMLRQKRVDGLILSGAHLREADLMALRREARPVVLVDRTVEGVDLPHVVTDSVAGMTMAVDHLVKKGHRRIAFIGGPHHMSTFRERLAGFRAAISAHGLRRGPHAVVRAEPEPARRATAKLFRSQSPPTALIAANIWLTIGALRGAPDDVEIVGFDDIYFADMLRRPVTTIAHDLDELGRQAVTLLLEQIAHPGTARKVILPPRLIVR
jgi:LacI family transcriptional regulator